ncbi:peroxidasin homolog isoform X3 [Acropora muricata]|uniref:peroxidasin homolog isoform X3 n=1 Tax=Acropora muricata TaxID=159855 RepID=UPI0034E596B1
MRMLTFLSQNERKNVSQYNEDLRQVNDLAKGYSFTEGDDIQPECRSDGRPLPTVTWRKNGGYPLIKFKSGERQVIVNACRSDAGDYLCTAENGIGNVQASAEINVNVFFSPTIAAISLDQTVNETGNVTLSCQAKGLPPPTITWLKADDERKNLSSTSELSLKNINRDQDGLYLCIANNRAGKAIASVAVTVHYKPRATRLTSNLPENTVTLGQPVKFHCSADGVPSTMYEFRFENIFLGDSREGVFVIQKVNSSHQGKYECTPKNILGHGKIATIILNVVVFCVLIKAKPVSSHGEK